MSHQTLCNIFQDKEPYISSSPPPSYPDVRACDRYDPPLPNFWAPGKRISEASKYQTHWMDDWTRMVQDWSVRGPMSSRGHLSIDMMIDEM